MDNGISEGPAGGPGAEQPEGPFRPPTEVEHQLYEAGETGDWTAFFATLAATDLFVPARRDAVDADPGRVGLSPFRDPDMDGLCQAVYTRGLLPEPVPGQVHERTELAWLARIWPSSLRWLAVNPGTPAETFVPANPKAWRKYARRAGQEPRMKTVWTGPLHDALAHGMACGALLLVNNGHPWNHLGWQGQGYSEEQESLRRWWDITSRDQLLYALEGLAAGDYSPSDWEFALRVREALVEEYGSLPDGDTWRDAAERVLLARTAELVESTGRPPGFDLHADIESTRELIGRILRYEARFRADGLLVGEDVVRSVLAWDFGRASAMARWGLGARYCEPEETRRALLTTGANAREVYRGWGEYAAGYILGRCLHFDDEAFGSWYTDMVAVHRILTSDVESPWLSVPWHHPPEAASGADGAR
ncbi:DUF1266 domain-containing protein [Streptomyces bohaiensis]|uniref:DUF1266 domain-containing protein n=1 Tax=Streptomyces bohaiensis TaxID=1431344 RepID=A0ABX1CMA8_9ACTN|nr:DUF1266 domain-containing protein [Streptomyces bohaiensis]NJQ17794.1 DUF1266 domain-containing protein [Streptomyces bohaiensis]